MNKLETDNSLVGRLLPEDRALLFRQRLPGRRERHVHIIKKKKKKKVICRCRHGSKNPIIYSSPHCPGALVTQMGRERDDTRDFNPSSAARLGGESTGGHWPYRSPWTLHIYLVLFLAPYWIVAPSTHLYAGNYRYSLSHEPATVPC